MEEVDWDAVLAQLASSPDPGWATVEEACTATGMARSTLRAWYREGVIPSRMVAGPHGPQRMVPMDAVVQRAMGSSRIRRQLERTRSTEQELAALRARVERLEALLGVVPED